MNPTTVYSATSASGELEEPLPADIPRDDLEAVEHGGAPKPAPPTTDEREQLRTQLQMWKARAQRHRADTRSLQSQVASLEADLRSAHLGLRNARHKASHRQREVERLTDDLEQARATIAHLRGIAGRITEHDAA